MESTAPSPPSKQTRGKAEEITDDVTARATQLGVAAKDTLTASRNAGLAQAEKSALDDGAEDPARVAHTARMRTGSLDSDELPIRNYDTLGITEAVAAVKKLTKPKDLRAVIGYEENNRNRRGVASAAQVRLAGIAKQTAGIS